MYQVDYQKISDDYVSGLYGPDRFLSAEEKHEYDQKVEEEIHQFDIAWMDAGQCAQPMKAWMDIRERVYQEMVAKRPKTDQVRNITYTYLIRCLIWCQLIYAPVLDFIAFSDVYCPIQFGEEAILFICSLINILIIPT